MAVMTTRTESPTLVDSDYAATWLGVSVATINRKCRNRELPGTKFGHRWYLRKDQLEQMFDQSAAAPTTNKVAL
jgi:excisionase family DNA binding protein